MSPLYIPPRTPGFDAYAQQTAQPSGTSGWLRLLARIGKAWSDWRRERERLRRYRASGRILP